MDEQPWTVRSMAPLVQRWDEFVTTDRYRVHHELCHPEIARKGSVLRPPATEDAIRAAQDRLGVQLPASYRSFLLISDGAHASSLGMEMWGDRSGLLPVEHVAWQRDVNPHWIELWCNAIAGFMRDSRDIRRVDGKDTFEPNVPTHPHPQPGERVVVDDFERAANALLISAVFETYMDILMPPDADGSEWEMWSTHKEGADAHHCFADALDDQIRSARRHPRPDPALLEEYEAKAGAGDYTALILLSELNADRAAAIALSQLDGTTAGSRSTAADVLGAPDAIGARIHLDDLRSYRDDPDPFVRLQVLSALLGAGELDTLDQLRALTQDATDDRVSRWATMVLRRSGYLPRQEDPGPHGSVW
jgi:hypothetical protein